MEEQLISFETAKLAKEKGFSLGVQTSYVEYHSDFFYDDDPDHRESHHKGDIYLDESFYTRNNANGIDHSNENYTIFEAPTQSLLQKWLRDKHEIILFVLYMKIDVYYYQLYKKGSEKLPLYPTNGFDTYEEALEKGLQEALKLLT